MTSAFDMLYLTPNNAKGSCFQVREFLNPSQIQLHEMGSFRKSVLGQLITQTLNTLGIESNGYSSSKEISHEQIGGFINFDFKAFKETNLERGVNLLKK